MLLGALASGLLATQAGAQAYAVKGAPDSDKLEASAEHVARMKTALKQVLGRVEEARNEKDVVKLNCVNEKLTQIKALLKVAEQADVALHEAIANRDAGADSEFSKIAIARTKVDGLRAESEQCIGAARVHRRREDDGRGAAAGPAGAGGGGRAGGDHAPPPRAAVPAAAGRPAAAREPLVLIRRPRRGARPRGAATGRRPHAAEGVDAK